MLTRRRSSDNDKTLRFYFDYISSNAYLAWKVVPQLAARYDLTIEPIPTLFAGLLAAHGQVGPAEVPVKSYWMWKNNLRKAAILGVPLEMPAFHPFNPLLSLRVSSLDLSDSERVALIDALFDAVWVRKLHVSEPDVVAGVIDRVGLSGARLVEEAGAERAKLRLRAQTDTAIELGVFGVPTMTVGNELFWGYDDLPYLERLLAGDDPLDAAAIPDETSAPRPSAMRKQAPAQRRR
jgi:2-hydroxychromene-2-carboxylate isomerase